MGADTSTDGARVLEPAERTELLDAISRLHEAGIDGDIGLPHILLYEDEAFDKSRLVDIFSQLTFRTGKLSNDDLQRLEDPRAIIMVAISAVSDPRDNDVLNFATGSPEISSRTLAIIADADVLHDAPGTACREALENQNIRPGLGWHLIRTQELEQAHGASQHGGQEDDSVFAHPPWDTFSRETLGTSALRARLMDDLLHALCSDVHSLCQRIESRAVEKESSLRRLGPLRLSVKDQRRYLGSTIRQFTRLIEAGLDEEYLHKDFSDFFAQEDNRLRSTITETLEEFAFEMRTEGRSRDYEQSAQDTYPKSLLNRSTGFSVAYLRKIAEMSGVGGRKPLPRQIPSSVITTIFRQQSAGWKKICRKYIMECEKHIGLFMAHAIARVASDHTAQQSLKRYIQPALDARLQRLESKLQELLWPYQSSHATTYSRVYQSHLERIQSEKPRGLLNQPALGGLPDEVRWTVTARKERLGNDLLAAAEAVDRAEAYYQTALDTLVDNVAMLGIEACLLNDLADIIPDDIIYDLTDEEISNLAEEPTEASEHRKNLERQVHILQEVTKTFRKYAQIKFERDSRSPKASPSSHNANIPFRPREPSDDPPPYEDATGPSTPDSIPSESGPDQTRGFQLASGAGFGQAQSQGTNSGLGTFGIAQPRGRNSGFGSFGQQQTATERFGSAQSGARPNSRFDGNNNQSNIGGSLFGSTSTQSVNSGGLFGGSSQGNASLFSATQNNSPDLLGQSSRNTRGLFGQQNNQKQNTSPGLFGGFGAPKHGKTLFDPQGNQTGYAENE